MPSYRRNIAGTPKQCIRTFYVPIQASIAERPIVLIVSGAVSVVWHDAFYEFELYLAADPQLQHLLDHVRATMGSIQHQPCPPEGIRRRRVAANQDEQLHARSVSSLARLQECRLTVVKCTLLPPLRDMTSIISTKMHLAPLFKPSRLDKMLPGLGQSWVMISPKPSTFRGTVCMFIQLYGCVCRNKANSTHARTGHEGLPHDALH